MYTQALLTALDTMRSVYVNIALPSHPNLIEIFDQAGQYIHENQIYLDE